MTTRLTFLALIVAALLPRAAVAKDASLSMIYSNAVHDELPFAIFSKGSWRPDPNAKFVKLHLYFDDPIMVQGISMDPCGGKLTPNISIFFNFDQWILHLDPDLEGEVPQALYPTQQGKLLVFEGFQQAIEVRSLTINFESNTGFKLCGIHIKDPEGKEYAIKTSRLVAGSVSASSTLEPRSSYDPVYLFDSRFEYGWASNHQAKDVSLSFKFDRPTRIEGLRIWNGYQRSVAHCAANSRARKVRVVGTGGYKAEFALKDDLGSQVVILPTPFAGTELTLEVIDAFRGKSYEDLVISEVRFYDGAGWFALDPTQQLRASITSNKAAFAEAKVGGLLNNSFVAEQEITKEPYYISSTLRLRADGSFYMSGAVGDLEYFALGNYEIKGAAKGGGLRLRLFGLYYETEAYGDCNGCGRDCNKASPLEGAPEQKIFQETMTFKARGDGDYDVVNESGGRKIKFKSLLYRPEMRPG